MRTNFFKIVLPMAVVALGLASAASTSSLDESAPIMGYKHIANPNTCVAVQECSTTGAYNCTAPDGSQLFAKPASTCLTPLRREVQ